MEHQPIIKAYVAITYTYPAGLFNGYDIHQNHTDKPIPRQNLKHYIDKENSRNAGTTGKRRRYFFLTHNITSDEIAQLKQTRYNQLSLVRSILKPVRYRLNTRKMDNVKENNQSKEFSLLARALSQLCMVDPTDNPVIIGLIEDIRQQLKEMAKDHGYGTKYNSRCIKKAEPNEPIFVLRANDPTAPALVKAWATLNRHIQPMSKLISAGNLSHSMDLFLTKKREEWKAAGMVEPYEYEIGNFDNSYKPLQTAVLLSMKLIPKDDADKIDIG